MKRIRGGSGLGDAIYQRPIVEHFLRAGEQVLVMSAWADVFLGTAAEVLPFRRDNIDVLAHYTLGKGDPATTQWQDILKAARMDLGLPLRFDWTIRNEALIAELQHQAAGRPIVVVHGGRTPMDRVDGFGKELLPDAGAFDAVLGCLQDCFKVRIGKGRPLYSLGVDLDLTEQTTVPDMMDIVRSCAAVVAQCSFAVPLAEVFDRPLLAVWAARGMSCSTQYVRQITPRKVLSNARSRAIVDDWPIDEIREHAHAFRQF